MKLLIVDQFFYPDQFRINDIARALVKRGNDVDVLTGLPDYATNHVPEEFKFFRRRKENYDGVKITRVPIIARRTGALFRILNYFSFVFSGSVYVLFSRGKYDVIMTYATSPITMAVPGIVMGKKLQRSHYLYCVDLWPECVKVWGYYEGSLIYKVADMISRFIYKRCDHIAVTSKAFIQYITERTNLPPNKFSYLPQHAEDMFASGPLPKQDNGCVDFMFAGNTGSAQNLDCIIMAVDEIKDIPGFKVHILGDGTELEKLKDMSNNLGLEGKIIFYGRKPLLEMPSYYQMADVFLLTLTGDSFVGQTIPAKLQSYMSASRPVIAAADGATDEIIRASGCGTCVSAGDYKNLALVMKDYIKDLNKHSNEAVKGRQYFEQHFLEKQFIDTLSQELSQLVYTEDNIHVQG